MSKHNTYCKSYRSYKHNEMSCFSSSFCEQMTDLMPLLLCILYSVFSINKNIFICILSLTIKIQKINIDKLLPSNFNLANCLNNIFFTEKGSSSQSCVIFHCHVCFVSFSHEKILSLSLTFIFLALLKMAGQLFCRRPMSLDLSDVSLWLYSRYTSFSEISHKWHCVPPIALYQAEHNFISSLYW